MTYKRFIMTATGKGYEPIEAKPVTIDWFTGYVYKHEDGGWYVNETQTGMTIIGQQARTRKAAIERAAEVVGLVGPEKMAAQVEKQLAYIATV